MTLGITLLRYRLTCVYKEEELLDRRIAHRQDEYRRTMMEATRAAVTIAAEYGRPVEVWHCVSLFKQPPDQKWELILRYEPRSDIPVKMVEEW